MLKAYLTLFRFPSVFSAMSNIWAGYFIAGGAFSLSLPIGMLASAFVIMGGMALNDVADKNIDALERPTRPIPSRKIRALHAAWAGYGLLFLALVLVAWIKLAAVIPAFGLCYCVYLYNFVLKSTSRGPFVMALCRVLNLTLGISLGLGQQGFWKTFNLNLFWILLSLGLYIFLVTYIARDETKGNSKERVTVLLVGIMFWLGIWLGLTLASDSGVAKYIGLAVIALQVWILRGPLYRLAKNPDATNSGMAVGVMLFALPLVDVLALSLAEVSMPVLLFPFVLMVAAKYLGKKFYIT